MTLLLLLGLSLAQQPGSPTPVAMVLEIKGPVKVQPAKGDASPAQVMMLLSPGDRLTVGEAGGALLVFFQDRHSERLGKGEVVVRPNGCDPDRLVTRLPPPKSGAVGNGIQALRESGRVGGAIFRGGDEE